MNVQETSSGGGGEVRFDRTGRVKFPCLQSKVSDYLIVKELAKDDSDLIYRTVEFLYTRWRLDQPQLILSVTGGAKNFALPSKMKIAFKRGLVKAAESTSAWIITGGTNTGVMRLVGEAVAQYSHKTKIPVLGIPTFNVVAFKEKLEPPTQGKASSRVVLYDVIETPANTMDVLLDPNHSHFILVDDAIGKFGGEINFRANLEAELRHGRPASYYAASRLQAPARKLEKGVSVESSRSEAGDALKVPTVLIVVNGGPNTLKTVIEALDNRTPVVVLEKSKGGADLIARALASQSTRPEDLDELIRDPSTLNVKDARALTSIREQLIKILGHKSKDLVTIFSLDSNDSGANGDIEMAILKAFLNSQRVKHFENMRLAISWNRIDIAREYIFTGDEVFTPGQLNALLEFSLVLDKPDFVELLLENNVNTSEFLTCQRLYYLYNYNMSKDKCRKTHLGLMLERRQKSKHEQEIVTFKAIRKLLKELTFQGFNEKFLPADVYQESAPGDLGVRRGLLSFLAGSEMQAIQRVSSTRLDQPVQNADLNLFIWSILTNRIEIAKLFWRKGENQIASSLLAGMLLKRIAVMAEDSTVAKQAEAFEEMAIGVLGLFDENEPDFKNQIVLLSGVKELDEKNCLDLAVEGGHQQFVATPCVQGVITKIWNGFLPSSAHFGSRMRVLLSYVSFGLLAPLLLTGIGSRSRDDDEEQRKEQFESSERRFQRLSLSAKKFAKEQRRVVAKRQHPFIDYWQNYFAFMRLPKTNFVFDTIFYLIFLALFSYTILCEFHYHEDADSELGQAKNYSRVSREPDLKGQVLRPSWVQYLLIVWILSFICEEFRNFFGSDADSLTLRVFRYFQDFWNYFDTIGCLLFLVGMTLRFAALCAGEEVFTAARIILCADLIIWYVRLLHVTLVFKTLGPKLVMIINMIKDLLFFITIIAIFLCAYGITAHAAMFPKSELGVALFKEILDLAYWPIYGEIRIMDESLTSCDAAQNRCPTSSGLAFSYITTMGYMVIANVLLINLLIAVFSHTFTQLQDQADQIWKFQRFKLVEEYDDYPVFSPPLNLLVYVVLFVHKLAKGRRRLLVNTSDKHEEDDGDTNEAQVYLSEIKDLERKYSDLYLRKRSVEKMEKTDFLLKTTLERIESLEEKLNEISGRVK